MALQMFQNRRDVKTKCPHCHDDVSKDEPKLFLAGQAFHRGCWIRGIIGPIENHPRGKEHAVISTYGKKHIAPGKA